MKHFKYGILALMLSWCCWQTAFADDGDFSNGELDRMLAPVALYPDIVLTHVLIAATYPLEVIEADRWVKEHGSHGGQAAVDGVSHFDWDPSVKALVAFPDLLDRMSDDLDWLQDLGEAFLADEGRVLDRVQDLREKAYAEGSLDDMQHLKVVRETKTIYLEPVEERVVYLPYYDPVVVYGGWYWPAYPPVVWRPLHPVSYTHFYWGPRYSLSTSFYFGAIAWPRRTVVFVNHNWKPSHYRAHSIAHHAHAKRWAHDPYHRRHVAYRHHKAHRVFGDPRHDTHYDRHSLRREVERSGASTVRKFGSDRRHSDRDLATSRSSNRNLAESSRNERDGRVYSSRNEQSARAFNPNSKGQVPRPTRDRAEDLQARLRENSKRYESGERSRSAERPQQIDRAERSVYQRPQASTPNTTSRYERPADRQIEVRTPEPETRTYSVDRNRDFSTRQSNAHNRSSVSERRSFNTDRASRAQRTDRPAPRRRSER